LAAWRQVPSAQFNLVLSSWAGVGIARNLEERFGTPWLHYSTLPIGAAETSRFLRTVAEYAGLDSGVAERFIAEQESLFYYYFEQAADFFLECRYDLPGHLVTMTDSFYGLGIARMLTNEFGLLPGHHFVTDNPPDEFRPAIVAQFSQIAPSIAAPVTFTDDGGTVRKTLLARRLAGPIVLGSSWDRQIAEEIGGYHLSISTPITDRLVVGCAYAGYQGGLRLVEDLYSSILVNTQ
jgi:nitrogenase molybdenum-iron protein beta chain